MNGPVTPARTLAEHIADFSVGFDPQALLATHRAAVARTLVDTHAVAVAGWNEPAAQRVRRYIAVSSAAAPASRLWGESGLAGAEAAALANGVAAHVLDYDDVSSPMRGHPSVALWPALLALAEHHDLPGTRLASAYVVGFEVLLKFSRAMAERHYARGWHSTPGLGTLAAAVACAHLLQLDTVATGHALGLAVAQTAGTRQNFGSDAKSFQAGHTNMAGVRAALLAHSGFTAGATALEGPGGFLDLYGGDAEALTAQLAQLGEGRLEIEASGIEVKKYPMCYAAHRALDGLLDLRHEHGLLLADVSSVDVCCSKDSLTPLIHHRPVTGLQAKFSMEYAVAAALADGAIGLSSFEDEAVQRPALQAFLPRVAASEVGESLFPRWTSLTVRLRSGRVLSRRIGTLRGSADCPLRDDELIDKAHDCYAHGGQVLDARRLLTSATDMAGLRARELLPAADLSRTARSVAS